MNFSYSSLVIMSTKVHFCSVYDNSKLELFKLPSILLPKETNKLPFEFIVNDKIFEPLNDKNES